MYLELKVHHFWVRKNPNLQTFVHKNHVYKNVHGYFSKYSVYQSNLPFNLDLCHTEFFNPNAVTDVKPFSHGDFAGL